MSATGEPVDAPTDTNPTEGVTLVDIPDEYVDRAVAFIRGMAASR